MSITLVKKKSNYINTKIQITKNKLHKHYFQKWRNYNYWNTEIQITEMPKYKLQKYCNLNCRNTNNRNTEIQIKGLQKYKWQTYTNTNHRITEIQLKNSNTGEFMNCGRTFVCMGELLNYGWTFKLCMRGQTDRQTDTHTHTHQYHDSAWPKGRVKNWEKGYKEDYLCQSYLETLCVFHKT